MQRFLLKTILVSFLSLTIIILPVSANSQITVNNSIRIKQNELSENVKDNQSVEIKVMLNGQETTQITPIASDKNNKMNITPKVRKIENQTPKESTEKVLPDKSEKQKVTEIKIPTQTLK